MSRRPDYGTSMRMLVTVYVDGTPEGVTEQGPVGFTTDEAALALLQSAADQAVRAWLLHTAGGLPPDWRLITSVAAVNLDRYPYRQVRYPDVEAAAEWAGFSLAVREAVVHDYRTVAGQRIQKRTKDPFTRVRELARTSTAPAWAVRMAPALGTSRVVGEHSLYPRN